MRKVSISKDLLRDLYLKQGLTTYQISEKLGFCQGTVWNRLKEYAIKPRLSYIPVNLSKKQLKSWYIDQKLSTWEIEKKFGYSRGTLYKKLKEFNLPTRNIAESHIRFSRNNFSGDILEKAYLIGFRIGDLNITKCGPQSETIVAKCATTKQGQLKLFKNLFALYGHIIEGKPTKDNKINIQANLNPSFSFLLDKSHDGYKWVFKNKKTFFAFLAGFSDAEGSFFITRGQGVFSIGNYDKLLLNKIKEFLKRFGVETPKLLVYYQKNRKSYNGYKSKSDYHTLHCSKKEYLLKLIDLLWPYIKHPDKLQKAQTVKENIIERNIKFRNFYQSA